MLLPPTPLSLLCAILLCLPLTIIFTFTTPPSTTTSHGGATTSPLPISTTNSFETKPKQSFPTSSTLTTQFNSQTNNKTTTKGTYRNPEIDENDEADDLVLFKRASRVDPNPKPVKKLAFMFLTTSSLPLAPLWELFFSRAAANLYNVYVHASPNIDQFSSFQGVFANRVIPSKPTRRHSPTLVSAARRLLAHALLHDKSNAMFALLSPSCIPIHSFNYTYKSLMRYSRKSFVEILVDEPGAYDRWAARGEDVMEPEVEYENFRIGSQFWVVKRKHARVIVKDRRVWSKFKLPCLSNDTCYPDEHYFPTLLNMVDPHGCIPCTLTHVDWRNSTGGHPRAYNASEVSRGLIRAVRKERPRYGDENINGTDLFVRRRRRHPFLFARKFGRGSLDQLIRMAKNVIFKD